MGEHDNEALSVEDTLVLSAEDIKQIREEVPEAEKSTEEEDGSS